MRMTFGRSHYSFGHNAQDLLVYLASYHACFSFSLSVRFFDSSNNYVLLFLITTN